MLTVTSRIQVFLSELNISSVTGRNSPRYAEILNYTPFEGNDRRRMQALMQKL
jgi:hypothetical protein